MPHACAVVDCKNRYSKGGKKKFYRFPAEKDRRHIWVAALNRKNWSPSEYSRVCSDHFVTGKIILSNGTICFKGLFASGQPLNDTSHPDYAPSICLFRGQMSTTSSNLDRHSRLANRRRKHSENAETLLVTKQARIEQEGGRRDLTTGISEEATSENSNETRQVVRVAAENSDESRREVREIVAESSDDSRREDTSEDSNESRQVVHVTDENSGESRRGVTMNAISQLEEKCEGLQTLNRELLEQIRELKVQNSYLDFENKHLKTQTNELHAQNTQLSISITQASITHSSLIVQNQHLLVSLSKSISALQGLTFGANTILNDDNKTCFYTGLPTYDLFLTLYNLLKPYHNGIPDIDYFFASLVYLCLHTPMDDLASRFQLDSRSTVSRIFHSWLDTMYQNLQPLVTWPDTDTLRNNMPEAFQKNFKNVKCIIDCFEIFTERPLSFGARAATYSNYKKHNTLKVFIAIAPTGVITFISKAWTGRVSDKVITQRCGFLDNIEFGDVVLADRGFNIHDDLAVRGAKLEIPAFTKGKSQLSRAEVETSRRLAHVRIHVERIIGQLRKKYKILQHTLPITLIKRPSDACVGVTTIDKILLVTAALTNLSQTIV